MQAQNFWEGASISCLLWENCRGFAPAIFRGTLGNWGHPLAYHYGKIAGASPLQFSGELLETGVSIISDIGTAGYPDKEREQTKMLNWAQSEVFNWATAEYSIMIKLKGSPYYHDYVDQGTILDRVVGSSRVSSIENVS